jgi:methylated-DNA-protein-cysteine methyltransferase-like protein
MMKTEDNPQTEMVSAIADTIRRIPQGKVSTYGAVATAAGYPRCSRHVARVLNVVRGLPWQRVLASGGKISLPGERGFEQRFLLQSEGVRFKGSRVDMVAFEHVFGKKKSRTTAGKKGKPPSKPKQHSSRRG